MNIHYSNYKKGYFILENKISAFTGIKNFQNNISIGEEFIRNLISSNADVYLEIVNNPKADSIRMIKNASYMYKLLIKSKENELRATKTNTDALQNYIEALNTRKELLDMMVENLQKNVLSTASYIKLGIRKNLPAIATARDDDFNYFINMIYSQGMELDPNINLQHRHSFNYLYGFPELDELHFIFQTNLATGRLYPFILPNYIYNSKIQNDIIVGNYYDNNIPIFNDIWNLNSFNGVIIGTTGSGKSATAKAFLIRNYLFKNRKIIVIDPQNEYLYTAKLLNGISIDIYNEGNAGNLTINIFDRNLSISENKSLSDKIDSLITFFDLALKTEKDAHPIRNTNEQFARDVIKTFYTEFGESLEPTFDDFKEYIEKIHKKFDATQEIEFGNFVYKKGDLNFEKGVKVLEYLVDVVKMLDEDEFKIFKGKTNINFNNDFIVFNIKNLPERLSVLATYIIMEYIVTQMYKEKDRQKIVLIDEAWNILSSFGADYIRVIAKTSRKFNTSLILSTQQLSDFTREENREQGKALLENIAFAYLYRINVDEKISDEIRSQFNLTDDDVLFLKNNAGVNKAGKNELERASSGILIMERDKYRIKFVLTKKELSVCESNVDALKEIIPRDIIEYRKELTELETINRQTQNKDLINKNNQRIEYLNAIIDTLRRIEDELKIQVLYDEENIRNFVIDKKLIYPLGISEKSKIFSEGINSDERNYLLENNYKEIRSVDYPALKNIFGSEIFLVKETIGNKAILVILNYLKDYILSKYKDKIYNNLIYIQQNDLLFQKINTERTIGDMYYVYNPKTKASLETDFMQKQKKVANMSAKYFTDAELSDGNYHIVNLRTNEKFSVPAEKFEDFGKNIINVKNSVIIKVETDYFTKFSEDELKENDCYYLLDDDLFEQIISSMSEGNTEIKVSKNIYRISDYEKLIKDIFSH
ncbi:MAG: ATP-binding protein [Caldisericia bacterium]